MTTKNRKITWLAVLLVFSSVGCQAQQAKITVKAVDDFGKPVAAVTVRMSAFDHWKPGEGFGETVFKNTTGITDTNGLVALTGSSPESKVGYGPHRTPGYYYTEGSHFRFDGNKDGRWQPWNPTVEIILRPIVSPVPMYARRLETHIPTPGQKYGFDLMVGDWVAPVGAGNRRRRGTRARWSRASSMRRTMRSRAAPSRA